MKHKQLIIITVIFFLLINTTYFWEGKLDTVAMLTSLILVLFYLVLAGLLFRQVFFIVKEKFTDKSRIAVTAGLLVILILTLLKPSGLIDFDRLSGKDLLIAQREGNANCTTTLKLKSNNKFSEKRICFGVTEIKGVYKLKGDTIFFNPTYKGRDGEYYAYALIKPSVFQNEKIIGGLFRYKEKTDTIGSELFIIKNDL